MTSEHERRKALKDQYRETRPAAGVYRIVNRRSGKALLGSSPNLASIRNRLAFAISTGSSGGFDYRFANDLKADGDAFEFEVLDTLDAPPELTDAQLAADLAALEALWREQLNPDTLY